MTDPSHRKKSIHTVSFNEPLDIAISTVPDFYETTLY